MAIALRRERVDEASKDDGAFVSADSGWFLLKHTRMPSAEDMAPLRESVGDASSLDAPTKWNKIKDLTIIQQHLLPEGNKERDAVTEAFMSTLQGRKQVKVIKVERIQNMANWQSYVVKRQVRSQ